MHKSKGGADRKTYGQTIYTDKVRAGCYRLGEHLCSTATGGCSIAAWRRCYAPSWMPDMCEVSTEYMHVFTYMSVVIQVKNE
eukprot:6213786-Pleurochrysis_carterae.AAC.1